jgi:hypothetical protein
MWMNYCSCGYHTEDDDAYEAHLASNPTHVVCSEHEALLYETIRELEASFRTLAERLMHLESVVYHSTEQI